MSIGPDDYDPGDEPVAAAERCDPVDHDDYMDAIDPVGDRMRPNPNPDQDPL